jgi:hypothetical protein
MFKTFLGDPLNSHSILLKSLLALKPVVRQLRLSGYVFAFQLPMALVRALGTGGNYSFLKTVHQAAAGTVSEYTIQHAQESMASSLGPGAAECKTATENQEQYPASVKQRQLSGNFADMVSYYRHGAATDSWHKSLETISALHGLGGGEPRRTSSGLGLFDGPRGSLRANATILWGIQDKALDTHLALEGISDYLVHGSQVVILPRTAHFTLTEKEGRAAFAKAVEWAVGGERGNVEAAIEKVYPGINVMVRK